MDEVLQVFGNRPRYFRNQRRHRAPLVMIGPTFGGRFLKVPLARTYQPGVWRVATAFDATPADRARYRS